MFHICSKNPELLEKWLFARFWPFLLIVCSVLKCSVYSILFLQNQQVYHHSHNTGMPWFYCFPLLSSVDNVFFFFFKQIEGLWQPCTKSVGAVFLKTFAHLHVSVSHLSNSFRISNFLIITVFVIVICDLLLLQLFWGTMNCVHRENKLNWSMCVFWLPHSLLLPFLFFLLRASLFPKTL